MTHDPLCPFAPWPDEHCYQPDAGVSICSIIDKVREDTLTKVREDERHAPLCEFHAEEPYVTQCVMCDLLAYMKSKSADAYDKGQRDGFQAGMDQMMGGIEQVSYDKGQRDMLAKCIDRMTDTDLDNLVSDDAKDVIFAALRALQEKP